MARNSLEATEALFQVAPCLQPTQLVSAGLRMTHRSEFRFNQKSLPVTSASCSETHIEVDCWPIANQKRPLGSPIKALRGEGASCHKVGCAFKHLGTTALSYSWNAHPSFSYIYKITLTRNGNFYIDNIIFHPAIIKRLQTPTLSTGDLINCDACLLIISAVTCNCSLSNSRTCSRPLPQEMHWIYLTWLQGKQT